MNFELNNVNLLERYLRLKEIIQPVIQKNLNENFTLLIGNGQLFAQIEGFFVFVRVVTLKLIVTLFTVSM